jgi:hypothetical protein
MHTLRIVRALTASTAIAGFGICSTTANADHGRDSDPWKSDRGIIYAMDNSAEGNSVLVFARDRSGRLHPIPQATARTGGAGGSNNAPVDPLGSQNSLVYDAALDMLFAVNAGDNTVTAFRTGFAGVRLQRTARVASGGLIPVSVAVSDRLLYVLNAGGSGTVATFEIGRRGQLTQRGVLNLGLANPSSLPFDPTMTPGQVGVDALARRMPDASSSPTRPASSCSSRRSTTRVFRLEHSQRRRRRARSPLHSASRASATFSSPKLLDRCLRWSRRRVPA